MYQVMLFWDVVDTLFVHLFWELETSLFKLRKSLGVKKTHNFKSNKVFSIKEALKKANKVWIAFSITHFS